MLLKFEGSHDPFWINPNFVAAVCRAPYTVPMPTAIFMSGSNDPLNTISEPQDVADRISAALDKRPIVATYVVED